MRIIAVFVVFLPLAIPVSVHAQAFGGIGTRAEGMGGAFVAVADDATAVYWNPAGIATGATFDLQVAKGDSHLFIGAAIPVLGASYYQTREVTGLPTVSGSPDRQTGGSGEVQVRTLATTNFGVTVVQTVVPGLVVGTTARVVRGGIEGFEGRTTVDLDAGAMVSAWDLRLGLTARNLREPEFEVEGGMVRMTRQLRVGAALAPRALPTGVHGPFSLAIDADLTATPDVRGDRRTVAAGGEYWLGKGLVAARGGVHWSTLGDSRRALSAGFTVRLPRSVHAEAQLTKNNGSSEETEWSVGARVTF
ncbi:MAG TPA: conjugal transfer protein TraF [Vicinamibacterales bacterium]|nr:conjugal transfer protein TraF [Vicinamibacterales bacterium]